jgi:hypothetical protein
MTYEEFAKIKAEELVNKMHNQNQIVFEEAKQCAIIAVDEILKFLTHYEYTVLWTNVKQEIEKL